MRIAIYGLLFLTCACAGNRQEVRNDPLHDNFYEKARLIMTADERDIYNHLPDATSREEFIGEFWEKRNPDPGSETNASKDEFERRIAYANRYFKENRAIGRGWNTSRGRILLQLGEPDSRELTDMLSDANVKAYERWYYYEYGLYLLFVDRKGFGEFELQNWPQELLTAIDRAKFNLDLPDRRKLKQALRFKPSYQRGELLLEIPVKKIHFQEQEGAMIANFTVSCWVYHNYRKVSLKTFKQDIRVDRENILGNKNITLRFPLPLPQKGKYLLDVILEEDSLKIRTRSFCRCKS